MKIACPRCAASYDVEAVLFGPRPRIVQCSACDWRWTQLPEIQQVVSRSAAAAEGDAHIASTDSWETSPQLGAAPEPDPTDEPVDEPVEERHEVAPSQHDRPEPTAEGGEEAGFGDDVPEDLSDDPADEDARDEPELDAAAASVAPAAVTGKRRFSLPHSRGFVAGTAAAAAAIALLSLLLVLREPVMALVPVTHGFYAMLGLTPDPLGSGLEIRDISSLREREGGRTVLTVSGVVANVVQHPAPLPRIRVSLYDTEDEELQFVTVPNERDSLDAGETLRFEARIADPRPEARRVRVGFAPQPRS